jgi:DGQHR domain-containing protein
MLTALKVHQWYSEWNAVHWDLDRRQAKPQFEYFFLCSIEARALKRLSGIQRRSTSAHTKRSEDIGIQRFHDADRSEVIRDFVQYGYPWSEMPKSKREAPSFRRFRKPGWLPTGVVVNILGPNAARNDRQVAPDDLISVTDVDETSARLVLPKQFAKVGWEPKALPPIEVIDGQHRLWAFDENSPAAYELPVVAFYDLDLSWQAYLFWSINITPKRINRSLAFDLYPLLRTEDWLDESLGAHLVYRETRAQELVESLYAHPQSPWQRRINMLGQTKAQSGDPRPLVSQNAWITSLLATLVKKWQPNKKGTGGLFGSEVGKAHSALQWTRAQQAAFLILIWRNVRDAVLGSETEWATSLRRLPNATSDAPFVGPFTLLTTDQGVRGVLAIFNDLCYVDADLLVLDRWKMPEVTDRYDEHAISSALTALGKQPVAAFIKSVALALAEYDWRTSSTPGLSDDLQRNKTALRGGSGYRILRGDLLELLVASKGAVGKAARRVAALDPGAE